MIIATRRATHTAPTLSRTLAMVLCGALLGSCGGETASEIVLVVDTDIAPTVIDTFTIVVRGPSAAMQNVTVPYGGAPRTLGLVAETEVLGPVEISITGSASGTPTGTTITRVVETRFEKGVSRVLHVRLSVDCLGITCTAGQTCSTDGLCVSADVDPADLPAYLGTVSVSELCNGVDDDADGRADEDFNLSTSPLHCGACNVRCSPGVLCVDSACADSEIVQISTGSTHSCALRSGGGVACWGSNGFGELGDGTSTMRTRPVSVSGISDAIYVSAGFGFTCAIRQDQSVMCWGSNSCGELGLPASTSQTGVPTLVPGVSGAVEIRGGNCHNCARLSSGSVYCWGRNANGQIGNGVMMPGAELPVRVMNLANAASVNVGFNHSCALRSTGAVSCWGDNASRQLGDGSETARAVPTSVIGLADLTDATMRATALAGGLDFTCILTGSGARCWGANGSGQLGLALGTMWDGMVPTVVPGTSGATGLAIGAPSCFGCVLGAGGVVSCWGCNGDGQLANSSTMASATAAPAMGLPPAAAIALGETHACALTPGGAVWCWGGNGSGQLGIGSGLPTSPPAQVAGL